MRYKIMTFPLFFTMKTNFMIMIFIPMITKARGDTLNRVFPIDAASCHARAHKSCWLMSWWRQPAGRKVTENDPVDKARSSLTQRFGFGGTITYAVTDLSSELHKFRDLCWQKYIKTRPYFTPRQTEEGEWALRAHASTYGNVWSGWPPVHARACFDACCFLINTLKPSGWGSSGRKRKRRDWGRCRCPLNQRVRREHT